MKKRSAKFLSAVCAAVLAVNTAAVSAFAEDTADAETVPYTYDCPIFTDADNAVLYWATQVGWDKDWWTDAPSGITAADNGCLYVCAADSIYKLDKYTGEITGSGKMAGQASYATKGPAYADGKVFMALDNGTVQAFDADTLTSLWIYRNKLGGSPTCDIAVNDGKIYTGFWNGEENDADYVCLDTSDPDADTTNEEINADWEFTNLGGYYWTAPAFTDDYIFIGRENGVTSAEKDDAPGLIKVDKKTREASLLTDSIKNDVRSKIVTYGNKLIFTDRSGTLYSVDEKTGVTSSYKLTEQLGLEGFTCTSTPIIENDRVYITLNGTGWNDYNGSLIAVFDYVGGEFPFELAYTVETKNACQADGIFAGVDADGYNVIYYVENGYPGTIRVLRDKKGMTAPINTVTETDENGKEHICPDFIFKPQGAHAQYCAVDPVFDPQTGLIFVRNDSFNILAIGPAADKIEFTANDIAIHRGGTETLVYMADQTPTDCDYTMSAWNTTGIHDYDPMDYTTFSVDKFTTDDEILTVSFRFGLYTGVGNAPECTTDVEVLVAETEDQYKRALAQRGDVNGDGRINVTDISIIAANVKGIRPIDKYSINAADTNSDGSINVSDIVLAAAHVKSIRKIDKER